MSAKDRFTKDVHNHGQFSVHFLYQYVMNKGIFFIHKFISLWK
jgi:hypothetical protein